MQAQPRWIRTGFTYFPFAARQSGQWWVLRFNFEFPAHDMYTLFIDGVAAADITPVENHAAPLVAGMAALEPFEHASEVLEPATAAAVVGAVSKFVDYGSEFGEPCIFCDGNDWTTKDAP